MHDTILLWAFTFYICHLLPSYISSFFWVHYLGIIAKIQFSYIPWLAIALFNSTFINYVNITFPYWNGPIWWRQIDLWRHWFNWWIMQESLILGYYAQIWKFGPGPPKMEFFKTFLFLWKGLQISLLTSLQPLPDINFKSSYARQHIIKIVESRTQLLNPEQGDTSPSLKGSMYWTVKPKNKKEQ